MSLTKSEQREVSGDNWDITIGAKRHWLDLKLGELWKYRDLLLLFVKRDIITIYKQTILGPIWFFIQPILTMLIFIVVFGKIAGISTDGLPQSLFYLSGIIMWNYFAECFNKTSDTFMQNAQIFGKVYFPRLIIPLSKVISNLIKFLIQSILFFGVLFYFLFWIENENLNPNTAILITPLLLILMAFTGLAFGLIFSSLTTKYRDLKFLIQFGVQLMMYATPIIYPVSTLEGKIRDVILLNPITYIIEAFKYAFLGTGMYSIEGLIYSTSFMLITLFVGVVIFNRTEQKFMDTV